ncbi:ATP-dependent RNA helicase dbp2 [Binucleata daphniae]
MYNRQDSWKDTNKNNDSWKRQDPYKKPYQNTRSRSSYDNDSFTREKKEPIQNSPVPFKKCFYDPKINATTEEVEEFRKNSKMIVKGKDVPAPVKDFNDIEIFSKDLLVALQKQGYTHPTPIQAQGWPMALSGRDMVGIAQTGSGKTLSFVIPALIHANDQRPLRRNDGPIVLILAPTRELVLQINEVVDVYRKLFGMRSCTIYGGVSAHGQRQALRDGCEIVVATPGRLIDLYDQGVISLSRVSFLVLDEADRMLDMGFEPQLQKIIPKTNQGRQTLMWSATWPKEVRTLAMDFTKDAIQVNIGEDELTINNKIVQTVHVVEQRDKRKELLDVLKDAKKKKIIIFCNTKRMCDDLEYYLHDKYFSCVAIHGDKSQAVRDRVINDFKDGKKDILIATDVAARGLDVKEVYMVVNYDFPKKFEDYVHRIGRTARGDCKEGKSMTFFTYDDRSNAKKLVDILVDCKNIVSDELRKLVMRDSGKRSTYHRRW